MNPSDFVQIIIGGFAFGCALQIVANLARRGQP